MTIEQIRELVGRLNAGAGSLAALGAALDAKVNGIAIEPRMQPHIDALVTALGGSDALADLTGAELRPVLAEIRTFGLLNTKLLFAGTRTSGWAHTDETLQATGEISMAFPHTLKKMVAPMLGDLSARLETAGAAFLDVGVGVGMLSIEMARLWPTLRIVGIDPWAPSLALGHANVKAAGLEDRIELREQAAESLSDEDAFDLAWLPSAFVPGTAMPTALTRVHRALKTGGWVLLATVRPSSDPIAGPLARLRLAQFGGWDVSPEESAAFLTKSGFEDVKILPGPPNSPAAMIAGRK